MLRGFAIAAGAVLLLVVLLVGYNALRHLVFWPPHEPVRFAGGSIELAGTLVRPRGSGPFPAVVLLHGSGPEPRTDLPGRAVINALVRHGFAVLVYDKRGAGESGGNFDSALYRDFIADAIAAVDYLATRPEVDGSRLGLYTVSESGWFGPEIATRRPAIRFIFNKVASVLPWVDTVAWEVENEFLADGVPKADARRMADHARRRWRHYIAVAADPTLLSGAERYSLERQLRELHASVGQHSGLLPETLLNYDFEEYAAFAANAGYDPGPYLRRLDIPLFYVYAGRDVNTPTEACLKVLDALAERPGADITVRVYPELGHDLATWRGLFHVGYPPDYLETLGHWAASRVGSP